MSSEKLPPLFLHTLLPPLFDAISLCVSVSCLLLPKPTHTHTNTLLYHNQQLANFEYFLAVGSHYPRLHTNMHWVFTITGEGCTPCTALYSVLPERDPAGTVCLLYVSVCVCVLAGGHWVHGVAERGAASARWLPVRALCAPGMTAFRRALPPCWFFLCCLTASFHLSTFPSSCCSLPAAAPSLPVRRPDGAWNQGRSVQHKVHATSQD